MPSALFQKVISLRKKGKTLRQISKATLVPVSTVHLWARHVQLSSQQIQHIQAKHRLAFARGRKKALKVQKQQRVRQTVIHRQQGRRLIGKISLRELLLIGAALYWSEGFKKDSRLGFANSDPLMIKLFLKWLIKIGRVPRKDIRLRVGINHNYQYRTNAIQNNWAKITGFPLSQFQKPFYQKVRWKKTYPNPTSYLGVLRVRANQQRALFLKIQGMLEGLRNQAG